MQAQSNNETLRPARFAAVYPHIKPAVLPNLDAIPQQLRQHPNWILWRHEDRGGAKPNKTPYQRNGDSASVSDPTSWRELNGDSTAAILEADYSGVGFVLTADTPYTGVDLDNAVNPDGSVKTWAKAIVERLNSYTERTPSGTGLRVWVEAKLTGLDGNKIKYRDGAVEFYDSSRYFTVTGAHLEGTPTTIEDRSFEIGGVHKAVKAGESFLFADSLSPKVRKAMNGDISDYGNDRSAAVGGVLLLLAAVHQGDQEKMRADFEASRLLEDWEREKPGKWERLMESELEGAVKKWREGRPTEKSVVDPGTWRDIFHTYDEVMHAPPLTFAIDGFLQEEGVTMLGGLSGHGKTLAALAMTRALLEAKPLFDHFKVPKASPRVVYLIPECGLSSFIHRLRTFRLLDYVKDGRLLFRTLSSKEAVEITNPRILRACEGADVFLDTAVRFMVGDENTASDTKKFSDTLFSLTRVGARTVTGLHHSSKEFDRAKQMTLENVLRGSGDLGAMLSTCWGISRVDKATTTLFIENVKPRDFEPCGAFVVEGRPTLDQTGYFRMISKPGDAGSLQNRKKTRGRSGWDAEVEAGKMATIREMDAAGSSLREIGAAVKMDHKTIKKRLEEMKLAQELGKDLGIVGKAVQ
jgi:AAA domain